MFIFIWLQQLLKY